MNSPDSAPGPAPSHPLAGGDTFRRHFERSSDPIFLLDPSTGTFLDANDAAIALLGCGSKDRLVTLRPTDWSPEFQPNGRPSEEAVAARIRETMAQGANRFEWLARRADQEELPLEVVVTAVPLEDRSILVVVARDIRARKATETALLESQEILASVADNISEAIYRSDARHRLIFVNQAYLRLFRYDSLAELQAIPRERLYADPSRRAYLLERLAREGGFDQEEIEYLRPDGTRFWGLSSSHAIRHPHTGAVSYHVGAIADITARRHAANEIHQLNVTLEQRIAERTAALAESEANLRTLIDHAPEAIVVYDVDQGRFLDGNDNALRLFGVGAERLRQLTPSDVSPRLQPDGGSSEELAREHIRSALAGAIPVFDWTHLHASGTPIPCEIRLVRLPSEGRRLVRGSITDTSERRRRERTQGATFLISEAVHSADDLPALYERIHEIIGSLMPARNFYIALYNPETEIITFPYYRDEYFEGIPDPRPIDTGLTGAVLQCGLPLLVDQATGDRAREAGGALAVEGFGTVHYQEVGRPAAVWLGVPLKSQGRTFGVMAVQNYHDATAYGLSEKQILAYVGTQTAVAIERKRVDAELRRALERERELGVLKSNFVSMVSHEFRTPLGIILSSAGILDRYFDRLDPTERREQLASIQRSSRRMGDLMEEVLLLSRLDAARVTFESRPLDLVRLCQTVAEEVAAVTVSHCPIHVALELSQETPAALGDERLVRNILINLLTNAVKYSEAGRPVDLVLGRDGSDAVLTVRDRGIGIPESDREWLFHPFHRGRNVGNRPGTGLGLVIVQRCLDLHGGRIQVESTPGEGTTMTVRFPAWPPIGE